MGAATVSGPSAEHIDAVAEALYDRIDQRSSFNDIATAILTSSDPAVHAAMLDALTRAGVLTEETARLFDGFGGQIDGKPVGRTGTAIRRFVTEWAEDRP